MLVGGRGGRHSPIFLKLRESLSKGGHAAREMVTVYSVTFLISDSILLLLVVGQIFKTPLPSNGKCLCTYLLGSDLQVLELQFKTMGKSFRRKFVCK